MKKTISLLVTGVLSVFAAQAQKLEKELQGTYWFVTGDFHVQPKSDLKLDADSNATFDWKMKFLPGGKLYMFQISKESVFSATGDEIPAGQKFESSSYSYKVVNNKLYLDYSLKACPPIDKTMTRLIVYKATSSGPKKIELHPEKVTID